MAIQPLTVRIPVRGEVLVRIDGIAGQHKVGDFEQSIPISFTTDGIIGATQFKFTEKMIEEAIGPKRNENQFAIPRPEGVVPPTPQEDSAWTTAKAATLGVLIRAGGHQSNADLAEAIVAAISAHGLLK